MKEVWKDIADYEGVYQVSSLGRVKSLNRVLCDGKNVKGTIIFPYINNRGYSRLSLRSYGRCQKFSVHRLVAKAFLKNENNKPQVNHRDGNKTNNQVNNLEWSTASENIVHSHKTGLTNPVTKPVVQLTLDGKYVKEFSSGRLAVEETGVASGHISRCCLKTRASAGGYMWVFKKDYIANKTYLYGRRRKIRKVVQLSEKGRLINIFESVSDASRKTGKSKSSISRYCHKNILYETGYIWMFEKNFKKSL